MKIFEGLLEKALIYIISKVVSIFTDKGLREKLIDTLNGRDFTEPLSHKAKLEGVGIRVYKLHGVSNVDGKEKDENLESLFPEPGNKDGWKYRIENAELLISKNFDAKFSCKISWYAHNENNIYWSGLISGTGSFLPKAGKNLAGYVYLVCEGEAISSENEKEIWQVSYILRNTIGDKSWDGYWIMIDSFNSEKGSFGRIDLKAYQQD